ncbi:uncharacterized protein LOC134231399 [Saccostrea cucullata]|uniref:uncharacterized protein LOC134231399 n=1 Tax=Saccostrea cuccullata TaxID=36930 RepID=UPI002ED47505
MSESVFVGMCHKVGTSQQVAMRRDAMDITEILTNQVSSDLYSSMTSGSYGEGFDRKGSDIDTLIQRNDNLFMSSSLYRETMRLLIVPRFIPHGPCANGILFELEYDHAYCFASDFWPPSAASWIDRCHSWPEPHVVGDIIRSGCHFVAIGHKEGIHEDKEWRISFSRAEQILVYSMNHTQFLTYGLLKLILKDVINNGLGEEDKLLCSYHIKTAVFWVIQQNTISQWCPQKLLLCFWECFKLILKWVYEGVCPNFFIPQNNMFLRGIHGCKQTQLFIRLHTLYEKGLISLIHSPSIWPYALKVLYNPRLSICTDEGNLFTEYDCDFTLFKCISRQGVPGIENLNQCMKCLQAVEQLINTSLTPYHVVTLQKHTTFILQEIVFILNNMYIKTCGNKLMYIADRMSHRILKLTAKFGYTYDIVFMAMFYYKTMRFVDTLFVIEMTKVLQSYKANLSSTTDMYTEVFRGRSLTSKMRFFTSSNIYLNNRICYIDELLPEQLSSLQERQCMMAIPRFVLLHMLEILCYRDVDTTKKQTALCNLQHLVHHPRKNFIQEGEEDMSWQILGICYQVTGNPQAALYAYQQSLSKVPFNEIENATFLRIQNILQ